LGFFVHLGRIKHGRGSPKGCIEQTSLTCNYQRQPSP
jgi:hypothetical protein